MKKNSIDYGLWFVALVLCGVSALVGLAYFSSDGLISWTDYVLLLFLLNPVLAWGLLKHKKWAYYLTCAFFGLFVLGYIWMLTVFFQNSSLGMKEWFDLFMYNKDYIRIILFLALVGSFGTILWRRRGDFTA